MKTKRMILISASVLFFAGCSLTGGGGNDGGAYRSDDGGKTFSPKVAVDQNKNISSVDGLSLTVNPGNGNIVYLGTKSSGIFKSENAGDSWKQLQVALTMPTKIYSLAIDPRNPDVLFATAAIGGRGKIVRSEDAGATWQEIYSEPTTTGVVLSLAINPQKPENIFAGTDQGQIIFSEDSGNTWRNLYWAEKGQAVYKIAIDSVDPDLAYFVLFQSGVLRTTDGGQTFQELARHARTDTFSFSEKLNGAVSLKTDPQRGGWVYVGDSEGLLRSQDKGDSWEVVKTLSRPSEINIRSIAINPQNSDEIVCTVAQEFYKSVDGGVNWLPIQLKVNRTLEVVEYNPQNPAQIFVAMNQR